MIACILLTACLLIAVGKYRANRSRTALERSLRITELEVLHQHVAVLQACRVDRDDSSLDAKWEELRCRQEIKEVRAAVIADDVLHRTVVLLFAITTITVVGFTVAAVLR